MTNVLGQSSIMGVGILGGGVGVWGVGAVYWVWGGCGVGIGVTNSSPYISRLKMFMGYICRSITMIT